MTLDQAAYLQGAVAFGVVAGAFIATRHISLEKAPQVLPIGILLGLLVPCMNGIHNPVLAMLLMVLVGAAGGFFVVPMNALLQHRGCQMLSAGQSIAIQNFNENLSVMVMMLVYSGMMAAHLSFGWICTMLGLWMSLCMVFIRRRYHQARKVLNSSGDGKE